MAGEVTVTSSQVMDVAAAASQHAHVSGTTSQPVRVIDWQPNQRVQVAGSSSQPAHVT